jgi:hypothetical protein
MSTRAVMGFTSNVTITPSGIDREKTITEQYEAPITK